MAANKSSSANNPPFDVPSWAGKPPQGLHLDVMKQSNLVEVRLIKTNTM